MKVVGIIAEYNPFHNGHLYHMQQARKITGADYVVVVMSGNFVQRGTPAVTDKYTRAGMALAQGADLVIELPTIYATASAEYFAYGAVAILDSLGFIDAFCFGSECGNLSCLEEIARLLNGEPESFKADLNTFIKQGLSYPQARMHAILNHFEPTKRADLEAILNNPNNILGIEYCKAILRLNSKLKPYTISRSIANYHDLDLQHTAICSASALRNEYRMQNALDAFASKVPDSVYKLLQEAENKTFPVWEDDFSDMLYYKLLQEEDLSQYFDVSKDFALRIKNQLSSYQTYSAFSAALKTKQLTATRIHRALLHVLLNITKPDTNTATAYIRILGLKRTSSHLLKHSVISPNAPIITKVADAKQRLSPQAYCILQKDIFATHLYNQVVFRKFHYTIPNEYQKGIVLY